MMCDNRVAGGRDGVPPPSETMMTKCAAGGGTPALPDAAGGGTPALPDAAGGGTPALPDAAGGGTPALPVRKRIDHRGPLSIDVSRAWYFITLCAEGHRPWVGSRVPRDRDDAADFDSIANAILSAARWYHEHGKWRLALFLVMPDHVHFIVHVPGVGRDGVPPPSETMTTKCAAGGGTPALPDAAGGGTPALPDVIRHWKHYLSECYGILFQRDFWDTRIRDDRQYDEEFRYICNNPVRRGLCQTAREWRHVIAFDPETGEERERIKHDQHTRTGA